MIKTIEELEEMNPKEFLDYIIYLKDNTPELKVVYWEGEENINDDEYEYDIEDIVAYLKYDNVEKYCVYCPCVDERKKDIFNKVVFSKKGKKDRFPSCRYLNLIEGNIENELCGLAIFKFGYYKVDRKYTDFRFPNKSRVFEQLEHSYFDYENKEFIQVDIKQKKDEKTQEYLRRKKIVKYIKKRLKAIDLDYLESFDLSVATKRNGDTAKAIAEYLVKKRDFFEGKVKLGMLVKKLFFNIITEEYNVIISYVNEMIEEINTTLEALSEREDEDNVIMDRDFYKEYIELILDKVNLFFAPESEDKTSRSALGSFIFKEETYHNIAAIEKRVYLTDLPYNDLQDTDEEQEIDEVMMEFERVFTKEEREEIFSNYIAGEEKDFKTWFVKFVKPKKLPIEKVELYTAFITEERS
ncbi:hypothetical protein ORM40_27715 [Bacillus cereus]|uniref:hypothetical protein n=1 Tax=Bacillus cereus TaxID=1396 RepID=UPI002AC0A161|nr:hypothetical protein [Bacillus cereus]MDZ4508467.1 hypothetical protein [Bacillus cereus]